MNKFKQFLSQRAMPAFARAATQRHLLAIRNGIVQILPFVIAGSIGLILFSFPIGQGNEDTLGKVMPKMVSDFFYYVYMWSFRTLGLVAAIAIGSELAKSYRLNQTIGAVLGAASLLLWIVPELVEAGSTIITSGRKIDVRTMDSSAMLGGIVGSIIAVEIYRVVVRYNITIRLPKEVPPQVAQAFVSIVPVLIVTLSYSAVRHLLGFDLRVFLTDVLRPIGEVVTNNVGGAIIINFLISFIWWFGINLSATLNAMVRPFWVEGLQTNALIRQGATDKGEYRLFVEQFNQSFTQAGGSGTSLGMVFAILVFAKSKANRSIGFVSLAPGIFNINEPLIFGYPVMLNPYFLIPFSLMPTILTLVTWGLTQIPGMGISIIAAAPWTLPTPILALFATGFQWQGVVLAVISIVISFTLYIPFVKLHDRATLRKEKEAALAEAAKTNANVEAAPVLAKGSV